MPIKFTVEVDADAYSDADRAAAIASQLFNLADVFGVKVRLSPRTVEDRPVTLAEAAGPFTDADYFGGHMKAWEPFVTASAASARLPATDRLLVAGILASAGLLTLRALARGSRHA